MRGGAMPGVAVKTRHNWSDRIHRSELLLLFRDIRILVRWRTVDKEEYWRAAPIYILHSYVFLFIPNQKHRKQFEGSHLICDVSCCKFMIFVHFADSSEQPSSISSNIWSWTGLLSYIMSLLFRKVEVRVPLSTVVARKTCFLGRHPRLSVTDQHDANLPLPVCGQTPGTKTGCTQSDSKGSSSWRPYLQLSRGNHRNSRINYTFSRMLEM